jgi:hypothetical protein
MLVIGLILTIIVVVFNVISFLEDNALYNLVLKILNAILVTAVVILINKGTEKYTSIDCLNGKNKYEKRYIVKDSVVIDSIYVLKKEY